MTRKLLMACILMITCVSQAQTPDIDPANGVDATVDYPALANIGPWDDRNYQLTAQDLLVLSEFEADAKTNIPAFYRVLLRKRYPNLQKSGSAQYPRSAPERFHMEFGGLMINGTILKEGAEKSDGETFGMLTVPVNAEVKLNVISGAAEAAIAINPVHPDLVIAGANGGSGGQEMYYSSDAGRNWQIATLAGNTCCDPSVSWSSDGSLAYAVTLGPAPVWFYRSSNNGMTWDDLPGTPYREMGSGATDKEYLHVDYSDRSPYKDRLYMTWHENTVLTFGKSSNFGETWDTPIRFSAAPLGIGSDITTDPVGNVYYIWAATPSGTIQMTKSTNGGDSFQAATTLATTVDDYDYAIPAMDQRRAFMYVSADADSSGGTYDGSIYACWNDLTAPESGTPSNNHSRITLAYSRDAGANWTTVMPHPNDVTTVDRFHPWMVVDGNGHVHIMFYDTQRDPTRVKTDVFYTKSIDGGQTFSTPERITSVQSEHTNGFQYGDYNGMSLTVNHVMPIWADTRLDQGQSTPTSDVYAAELDNVSDCASSTLGVDASGGGAICDGASASLNAAASGGVGSYSYSWTPTVGLSNPNIANPIATPTATTTYTVLVTDDQSCFVEGSQVVTVLPDIMAYYPFWRGVDVTYDRNTDGIVDVRDIIAGLCQ